MDNRQVHILEVFIAGAAGLASGLCIGLLIAPRSGHDLRMEIAEQGRRIEDHIKQTSENIIERVRQAADETARRYNPGDINDLDEADGTELVRDLGRMPRR